MVFHIFSHHQNQPSLESRIIPTTSFLFFSPFSFALPFAFFSLTLDNRSGANDFELSSVCCLLHTHIALVL